MDGNQPAILGVSQTMGSVRVGSARPASGDCMVGADASPQTGGGGKGVAPVLAKKNIEQENWKLTCRLPHLQRFVILCVIFAVIFEYYIILSLIKCKEEQFPRFCHTVLSRGSA